MKYYSCSLRLLTSTAAILLASPLCLAANNTVTEITLNSNNQGLELRLSTDKNSKNNPSFVTVAENNTVKTTVFNTKLNLPNSQHWQQKNPAQGIETISINQIEENLTEILITSQGDKTTSNKQKLASTIPSLYPTINQQGTDLVFSFHTPQVSNQLVNKIPFLNLSQIKHQLPSLLLAQGNKDDKKSENINSENSNSSQDILVPNPEIIIGENAEEFNSNIESSPSPQQTTVPRAVAPPVGDMAVSNISTFPDTIDLGSNAIVPRLVLRDAPVREVLSLLARQAGLNIVFAVKEEESAPAATEEGAAPEGPTVSLDLENQSVQEVFDSILLISGLTASRRGNIVYIGEELPAQARNLISRTLRLNQVRAENAALFLASQGAQGQRLTTEVEETIDPETGRVVQRRELPANLEELGGAVEEEGSISKALLLRGLQIATDDRLNSITLVGEGRKVEMATAFLTQLDARRRQVAVNVKVIDVNLNNQDVFNSSFSFGINDSFFVQDQGSAILNFGDTAPPNTAQVTSSQFSPAVVPLIVPGATLAPFFDVQEDSPFNDLNSESFGYSRPNFGTNDNPFQPGVSDVTTSGIEYTLPGLFQFPKKFLSQLQAKVTSGNAKILTDPTLVVQEGQQATVKLAQNVIESVKTEIDGDSGTRTITPVIVEAGLVLTVNVERIDDNGFIALSVSPTVSSIGATQNFDSGGGASNLLNLLSKRELSSGLIRLRDGQTLILSGIIQDQERTTISKVPILGDIPLLGALFRSSDKTNERAEVIVLLTPEVIDEQAGFGYNYQPSKESREVLQKGGLTLPNNP